MRNLFSPTRREAIKSAASATLALEVKGQNSWFYTNKINSPKSFDDAENCKRIIKRAIDSAMSMGATYADARLTHDYMLKPGVRSPARSEKMAFGVRAYVNGYWGFASSTIWSEVEAERLGRSAFKQASANIFNNRAPIIELAPLESPVSGEWNMPVVYDPFEISYDEIADFIDGIGRFAQRLRNVVMSSCTAQFNKQERIFGSSFGQITSQRLYRTEGSISIMVGDGKRNTATSEVECLSPWGGGFEYFTDQPLNKYIEEAHASALEDLQLPLLPPEVGRFPVLISAGTAASLVSQTIGIASEIDRAMGDEANADGTSYIVDPLEMLGELKVGAQSLSVTGGRSKIGSVGRVRWDDEGVEPVNFDLIRNGVLQNMQTDRQGAGWLKDYYQRKNQPFVSLGCSTAQDGIENQMPFTSDLELEPDKKITGGLTEMREAMSNCIELSASNVWMDYQQTTGITRGAVYQIRNGKRSARIANAGMMFRTSELWNNLIMRGDPNSAGMFGLYSAKGEPRSGTYHSVTTPPIACDEMSIVDVTRKA